ncbi:MAG: hypothetical protein JNG90_02355 [Planctomycetaceae bacterium]|nr:hypothetical protein [Planctomycetaceae bacterium]
MKRLGITLGTMSVALALCAGCDREATTTTTETVTTPGGETTVETSRTVESSGDHPPAVDGQSVPPQNP